MKSELKKYIVGKELGNSLGIDGFVAWGENYPLQKTVVDHNQKRVITMRRQEISD